MHACQRFNNSAAQSQPDVEYELSVMTRAHRALPLLFVAGDGLSLMRINHLLANHPDKYIDQTPWTVNIAGDVWTVTQSICVPMLIPKGVQSALHCF